MIVAVVTVLVPAVATAASSPIEPPAPPALVQEVGTATILTPVDESVELAVETSGEANLLTWDDDGWNSNVFYRVYRSVGTGPDTFCSTEAEASWSCYLKAEAIGTTRDAHVRRRLTSASMRPIASVSGRTGRTTQSRATSSCSAPRSK